MVTTEFRPKRLFLAANMPAWQPRNIAEALISFRDFNVRFGGGRGVSRATVRYVRFHLIAIILGRPLRR